MEEKTELLKDGLGKFTKQQLLEIFPSLGIQPSENKGFIIEAIISGSPTDEEKVVFEASLIEKVKLLEDAKSMVPKAAAKVFTDGTEEYKVKPGDKFIVEHTIKEDGKVFKKGDDYKGKKAGRYMRDGQIRLKD